MKTINFIAAVITSVMVSVNANAKTENHNNVPAIVEVAQTNSRSMVQTYEDGNSYKYDYILDNNGRVVNKISSRWNSDTSEWVPVSAYSVVYTNDETVLSFARYNPSTKTYSKDVQQSRYNSSEYPVIIRVPECCK